MVAETEVLCIDADDIIVEPLPERAGGELALFLMNESDWEPGVPIQIDLRKIRTQLLISSFFATFMKRIHVEDPSLCRAAVDDITWLSEHEFQQSNIQSWMEPWKAVRMTSRRLSPTPEIPVRGDTIQLPVEYTDVNKLRELYPEQPHNLARYTPQNGVERIVEVISYPAPPSKEDMETWARSKDGAYHSPVTFPQATILIRSPNDCSTVTEAFCFQVERVPHEDDDGRVVGTPLLKAWGDAEKRTQILCWWMFYRLDAMPHVESPKVLFEIVQEFEKDPQKCDKKLSEGYDEYGPPRL